MDKNIQKAVDAFNRIYDYFYENGYDFGLVEAFDFLLKTKKDKSFIEFQTKLAKARIDYVTSDRECAVAYILWLVYGLETNN